MHRRMRGGWREERCLCIVARLSLVAVFAAAASTAFPPPSIAVAQGEFGPRPGAVAREQAQCDRVQLW